MFLFEKPKQNKNDQFATSDSHDIFQLLKNRFFRFLFSKHEFSIYKIPNTSAIGKLITKIIKQNGKR